MTMTIPNRIRDPRLTLWERILAIPLVYTLTEVTLFAQGHSSLVRGLRFKGLREQILSGMSDFFSFVFIESGNLPDHVLTLNLGERHVRGSHEGPRGGTGTLHGGTPLPNHKDRQTESVLCMGCTWAQSRTH